MLEIGLHVVYKREYVRLLFFLTLYQYATVWKHCNVVNWTLVDVAEQYAMGTKQWGKGAHYAADDNDNDGDNDLITMMMLIMLTIMIMMVMMKC